MTLHNRVPLRGSEKQPVADAEPIAELHPDERIEVTVQLRSRAEWQLAALIDEIAARPVDQRVHLTREAFAERYGADPADVARVEAFAQANTLTVVETSIARRSCVLAGTVGSASAAFGVTLRLYNHPDAGTFRGRQGPIYIPSDLDGIVQGVFGLDDRPAARPHFRVLDGISTGPSRGPVQHEQFAPAQIAKLYDFPTGVNGQGQCVAIIELGGGYRGADLRAYWQQVGISPAPVVTSISVDHGRNQPAGLTTADGEVMLAIEVVGAVAPGAKIVVYFAPNTDQGFIDAITTAVHDTKNRPSVISIGWGAPEVSWTQAAVQAIDQAFQAASAMGVTVYCAAGVNGANDFPPGPGAQPGNHADFPASSPHAVGCGGTKITVANNAITNEVVWNDPGDGATGGGFSALFPKPSWQRGVQGGHRGVPDVAGNASPTSGYASRVEGRIVVIGGTSAVASLWAGLTALLNQKLGKPLGHLAPTIYGLSHNPAFYDITQGNNNGFTAAPGWDPCTGLGRPDGTGILEALRASASGAVIV
jgi:kumamolisin